MESNVIDLWPMALGLFGGLALFLFGLDQLTYTLKAVAGTRMRNVLARVTTNRFKGVLAGAFTTGVIQSSSIGVQPPAAPQPPRSMCSPGTTFQLLDMVSGPGFSTGSAS